MPGYTSKDTEDTGHFGLLKRRAPGSTALLLAMTVFAGGGVLQAARADEATKSSKDDMVLEELVVTAPHYVSTGSISANKSNIPLIETPQSVTVISRDQIDLLSWNSVQESVRYTAGVVGENFGPDDRYDWLTVRGFNPIQYIDGLQAPIGSVTNVGTDLYGSQSVEILKGPASVLYGQTPPGGIINMTSRRPQDQFGGEVGGQYGSHDHYQVNGDITGPVSDNLSFRLTGLYSDKGNQVDFVDAERIYIAPAVKVKFSEDTRITLLAYYQKDNIDNYSGGFLPVAGTLLPNPNGMIPVSRSTGEPGVNRYDRKQYGIGYDFSHDFSEMVSLHQNFKYFYADTEQRTVYGQGFVDADFDGMPDDYRTINRATFPFDEKITSYNWDTRADIKAQTGELRHNILVGFDYRRYKASSAFGFASSTFPPGSVPTLDVFNPQYGVPFTDPPATTPYTDQIQKQAGLYVQDQITLDRVVLTVSGRHDWVNSNNSGTHVKDRKATYRAGLNYIFENGVAPYVQTATSFQPTAGSDFDGNPFKPTTGRQFEAGIKYDGRTLGDDVKLFASAAAFTLKQKNVLVADPDHQFFQVQTGEETVKGIELEAVARIRERLSINASYTYTDSHLPAVSKNKASLLIDYTEQTGALKGLGAGIGVRYLSKIFGDAATPIYTPGVTLFDASVHYDTRDWRLAVSASNLFDKTYVARCNSAIDCFYGTKRVITSSLTRKF